MKKAKVVLAQPAARAPPSPLLPRAPGHSRGGGVGGGEEAYRARAKYKNLLQDYKELLEVGGWVGGWIHGVSWSHAVVVGFADLILIFGGFAIFRSVSLRKGVL